jgi:hypothetical protein
VDVAGSEIPLKVTLILHDFPGEGLINKLNLIVTNPIGKRYNDNVFEPPFDSSLDTQNNVESIVIPELIQGNYKIEVMGSNVAEGSQDYALVYSGMVV